MPTNSTKLVTITGEGFISTVLQYPDLRVVFVADADIDADGANGQNGAIAAYMVGNKGSEALGNGGMAIVDGKVVGKNSWFKDIVILGPDGQPAIFPGGIIASKTAYHWRKSPDGRVLSPSNPEAYVDSETVPYVCVPPEIRIKARGVVLGCRAVVTWNKKSVECVVADIGPRNKVGEISIAAARALGMNSNPRNGGVEKNNVTYELFPNTPAKIKGITYELLAA